MKKKMTKRVKKTIEDKVKIYLHGKKGEEYVIANNGEIETKAKILLLRQNIISDTFRVQVNFFNTWLIALWQSADWQWHDGYFSPKVFINL